MNVSAPNSAPDLTGLVLPQAVTDPGKLFSGFAPGQSVLSGAGSLHGFQATLESLLPAADSEAAGKAPKDVKKDEGKDLITGIPLPAPVEAHEIPPLRIGIPIPQAGVVDTSNLSTLTANSTQVGWPSAGTLSQAGAARGSKSGLKKAGAIEPTVPTATAQIGPELPPAQEPVISFVVQQGPEPAGRASREPLEAVMKPSSRGVPEPVIVTPEARVSAAQRDASAADLPHLAFTERLSATDRAPVTAPSIGSAPHASPPADVRTGTAEGRETEPNPATDKNRVAPAAKIDASHSSEHRSADEDHSHFPRQNADLPESMDKEGNRAPGSQEMALPAPIPVKAAANIGQPAPVPRPAEISRHDIEPTSLQPVPAAHTSEARTISLRLADAGEQRVDLKVIDRGGEVKIAVRTADADLAGSLRDNLGDLVHKLEQSGFRAESWHSAQPANATADHRDRQSDGESFHDPNQGQNQQQAGDGRQRKQQERDRIHWMEEIEHNTTPDSERSVPTWVPSSTR